MDYPARPKPHSVLSKLVKNLTDEEALTILALRAQYAAEIAEYRTAMAAYNAAAAKKMQDCRSQCEQEFGMQGHPKADLLWSKAWEVGHSAGLQEVYNAYYDLVELAR